MSRVKAASQLAATLTIVGVLAMVWWGQRTPAATLVAAAAPAAATPDGAFAPAPARSSTTVAPAGRPGIKRLLLAAARRHGVNPGLVMGVAWWESGWDQAAVSSTGAIGIMQVEPYTAASAGPRLLRRAVDIHDAATNVDLGAAILRENLDRYHNDLMKALVAYYAGPGAITDWAHLQPDAQRYVLGVHALAVAFDQGEGPA